MTNEAAAKKTPERMDPKQTTSLDPDPLRGQSLTIRVLEWPSGQINLTLTEKSGRPIASVQSGVHGTYPGLSQDEAREFSQAIVYRFNIYDQLVEQLARALTEPPVAAADEPTPAKDRIDAIADDLQAKIEQTKRDMETLELEYASERRHRELLAEHRDELEGQLAFALTRIERLQRAQPDNV